MIKIKKIEPVVWPVYDPDDDSVGVLNVFELNDLRIQIAKEQVSGYYVMFGDRRIDIRPSGVLTAWPNDFFDQYETQLRELLLLRTKQTSEQWQSAYPNPQVLDPDGWDRTNYDYSWGEELITYKEYMERVMLSTCIFNKT